MMTSRMASPLSPSSCWIAGVGTLRVSSLGLDDHAHAEQYKAADFRGPDFRGPRLRGRLRLQWKAPTLWKPPTSVWGAGSFRLWRNGAPRYSGFSTFPISGGDKPLTTTKAF